jgi:hypothetical protein
LLFVHSYNRFYAGFKVQGSVFSGKWEVDSGKLLKQWSQQPQGTTANILQLIKITKNHPGPAGLKGFDFTITSAIRPAILKGLNKTSKPVASSKPFHKQR